MDGWREGGREGGREQITAEREGKSTQEHEASA